MLFDRGLRGSWLQLLQGTLLVCAVAVPAGCTRLPPNSVKQIRQGHQAYERGRYDQVEQILTPVIARHAADPDVAEALYVRALGRVGAANRAGATEDLRRALRLTDRAELRGLLYAQLGNLDFEAEHYRSAIGHYRRALPYLPDRTPTDRIMLRHATALQRIGQSREAKPILLKIISRYPGGPAAVQAEQQIGHVSGQHAVQCGAFSNRSNAEQKARELRSRGFDATAWKEVRNGATRYVVRVGKYARRSDAERMLPAVRRVVPDAFIVP